MPAAFDVATRRLRNLLQQAASPGATAGNVGPAVCKAIERFVGALYALPRGRDELVCRAMLVRQRTRPETAFARAAKASEPVLARAREQYPIVSGISSAPWLSPSPSRPNYVGEVEIICAMLERVLADDARRTISLSRIDATALEQWRAACNDILNEAAPLAVDGCRDLCQVHRAQSRTVERMTANAAAVQTVLGPSLLPRITEAVDSLECWAAARWATPRQRSPHSLYTPSGAVQPLAAGSLQDKRVERLHAAFLEAADEFPDLHFAVATKHDGQKYGWPEVPRSDGHRDLGLSDAHWRELEHKQPGEFFANRSDRWLTFHDRLWHGTFFSGGKWDHRDQAYAENRDRYLNEAIARFKELAANAVANFGIADSVGPENSPLKPGPVDRWLETVGGMLLDASDDRRAAFNFKRLPGDVFTASARTIESLLEKERSRLRDEHSWLLTVCGWIEKLHQDEQQNPQMSLLPELLTSTEAYVRLSGLARNLGLILPDEKLTAAALEQMLLYAQEGGGVRPPDVPRLSPWELAEAMSKYLQARAAFKRAFGAGIGKESGDAAAMPFGSQQPPADDAHPRAKADTGSPDNNCEVEMLEANTPPLDRNSGAWVNNKLAAELDGIETRTLSDYRSKGLRNPDNTLGRDNDGRVWRRKGTPLSHPWYLRSTLRTPSK